MLICINRSYYIIHSYESEYAILQIILSIHNSYKRLKLNNPIYIFYKKTIQIQGKTNLRLYQSINSCHCYTFPSNQSFIFACLGILIKSKIKSFEDNNLTHKNKKVETLQNYVIPINYSKIYKQSLPSDYSVILFE